MKTKGPAQELFVTPDEGARIETATPTTPKPPEAATCPATTTTLSPPVSAPEAGGAQAQALLVLIGRLATDPNADLTKLERFLDLQERILAKSAEAEFGAALSAFQGECPAIMKSKEIKGQTGPARGSYCPYGSLMEQVQPFLTKHGFSVHFTQDAKAEGKQVAVHGFVRHRAGHKEPLGFTMPPDPSGGKSDIQAIGSTRSYAKRYAVTDFFNLRLLDGSEVDSDGNLRGVRKPATRQEDAGVSKMEKATLAEELAARIKAANLSDEEFTKIATEVSGFPVPHWRRLRADWVTYFNGEAGWQEVLDKGHDLEIL